MLLYVFNSEWDCGTWWALMKFHSVPGESWFQLKTFTILFPLKILWSKQHNYCVNSYLYAFSPSLSKFSLLKAELLSSSVWLSHLSHVVLRISVGQLELLKSALIKERKNCVKNWFWGVIYLFADYGRLDDTEFGQVCCFQAPRKVQFNYSVSWANTPGTHRTTIAWRCKAWQSLSTVAKKKTSEKLTVPKSYLFRCPTVLKDCATWTSSGKTSDCRRREWPSSLCQESSEAGTEEPFKHPPDISVSNHNRCQSFDYCNI